MFFITVNIYPPDSVFYNQEYAIFVPANLWFNLVLSHLSHIRCCNSSRQVKFIILRLYNRIKLYELADKHWATFHHYTNSSYYFIYNRQYFFFKNPQSYKNILHFEHIQKISPMMRLHMHPHIPLLVSSIVTLKTLIRPGKFSLM